MFKFEGKVKDLHELNCKVDEVHKFSTHVKDVHEFSKKIIDLHVFKSKVIDLHSFIVNVADLIIMKLNSFKDSTHSNFYIDEEDVKLLSKGRLQNIVKNTVTMMSGIKSKARIENTVNADIGISCYQGKSKKLNLYDTTKLNNMPTSLKNCCFDFANENWEEVLTSYKTWDDVKREVSSWNKLID